MSTPQNNLGQNNSNSHYDLVIIGGGMVGASLALLLKGAIAKGLKVALVDSFAINPNDAQQPSFDERTTALSLGTKRILDELGLWSELSMGTNAIEHIQVSQQQQFGRVYLHAQESQVEALGFVVENSRLGQALGHSLQALESQGLTLLAPAKASHYRVSEQGALLSIEQDNHTTEISTDLLVLADGAQSQGCKELGISHKRHDYGQSAVVCNVSFDKPHDNWAYERFTKTGPLALLPLTNNRFGLVWCMPPEQAKQHLKMPEAQFKASLQSVLAHDKGRLMRIGERQSYPLALKQAQEQVRSNVVVLGNAAHALHPVAGQGFNLALRDTQALANLILQRHTAGEALGDISSLQRYVQGQQSDQQLTTAMSHLLPVSFSQSGSALSILRSLSLTLMDITPVAKQLFARQAMGLTGSAAPWRP